MAARKVLVGFAVLALGAAIKASVATAFSPCGYRACSDEVAASGFGGQARGACLRQVIADCRAGLCSCTGGSPPCSCVCGDGLCGPSEDCSTCLQDCGPCPTTTTTTTTIATPQCNRDCSGLSCPPGEVGLYLRTQCGCAPEPGCGGSGGVCGGNLPDRRPDGRLPLRQLQPLLSLRRPLASTVLPDGGS